MQTVSVITTVDPALSAWLPQTANSVHAATNWLAKNGIALEWVVLVDGPGQLPKFRAAENVLMRRTSSRCGPAAAKNLATVAAHGQWLIDLPADAELYAAALFELLTNQGMTDVSWAVTRATRDGQVSGAMHGPTTYPPGSLAGSWINGLGFDADHLLVRKDAVLAVGGWPAVPALENLALVLRLNVSLPGVVVPHTVFSTREWEGSPDRALGWAETLTDARWALTTLVTAAHAASAAR